MGKSCHGGFMKIFLLFLFTTVALQNVAVAACDKFTLVQAQEISRIIAQNKGRVLNSQGKSVKVGSVCINNSTTKDEWSVAVNCDSAKSCKAVNAGTFRLKTEYPGQPNFHLAELANLPQTVCNVAPTPTSDSTESSDTKTNP